MMERSDQSANCFSSCCEWPGCCHSICHVCTCLYIGLAFACDRCSICPDCHSQDCNGDQNHLIGFTIIPSTNLYLQHTMVRKSAIPMQVMNRKSDCQDKWAALPQEELNQHEEIDNVSMAQTGQAGLLWALQMHPSGGLVRARLQQHTFSQ